jgi:hypothetical protein
MWSVIWGVLAVLHVTQSIWLSGGRAYPGDLGDGRFNQLLLEHGYQAIRGLNTWNSPAQFYPVQDTLAYSDTHAGTLPIYAALRCFSISSLEAWQLWFVVVTALNAVAAFRLFRALGVGVWLRGPVVFASVGSTTMVWLAGTHMQMLPIFPALFAWEQAILWCGDRRPWRPVSALGWLAWQFAASPYSAFFAGVVAGWTGLAWWLLRLRGRNRPEPPPDDEAKLSWVKDLVVFLAGTGLAALVLSIYLPAVHAGHTRPMAEIVDLAPELASWFTASPANFFYPAGWPGEQRNLIEHAWFPGFIPMILLATLLVVGWSQRRTHLGSWALALGLGTVATVLFFTKWDADGHGLWVWLAAHLAPLRAFRASGRVAGLLQFALIGAGGLLLTHWLESSRHRVGAFACVGVACLLALENLSHHQPSTLIATSRARTDALVAAWKRAGDRPILAFAPGFSNQCDAWMQLDAWSAALSLHRVTINGYSSGVPESHVLFFWRPSADNVRALLADTGIPEANVSIVESLGADAERRLHFTRLVERPLVGLEDFDLQPIGWTLFAPLERFEVNGRTMYQFTPPAEVRFSLPATATRIGLDVRMREGSYDGLGHSDGVGLTWVMRTQSGAERQLRNEMINPRDRIEDRGTLRREVILPPGDGRILVLRIDPGPRGDNAWDWPLFGSLRMK